MENMQQLLNVFPVKEKKSVIRQQPVSAILLWNKSLWFSKGKRMNSHCMQIKLRWLLTSDYANFSLRESKTPEICFNENEKLNILQIFQVNLYQ